jgi:hypothetical protein
VKQQLKILKEKLYIALTPIYEVLSGSGFGEKQHISLWV